MHLQFVLWPALALAIATGAYALVNTPHSPQEDLELANAPAASQNQSLHLRIFDELHRPIISTWPNETESVAPELQAVGIDAVERPISVQVDEEWPRALAAIAPLLKAPTNPGVVKVENVTVPAADHAQVTIPRKHTLPGMGTLSLEDADRLLSGAQNGTVVEFAGILPVKIVGRSATEVHFRVLLDESIVRDVPRARGLEATMSLQGDDVELLLSIPSGRFVTPGCSVGEYGLPVGVYEVVEEYEESLVLEHYPNAVDYALEGRTITIEVTILN